MNLDIDMDFNLDDEMDKLKGVIRTRMSLIGETYVATSRENGNYKDRTGNLRSGNGYAIAEEGNISSVVTGRPETKAGMINEIGGAGMEVTFGNGMGYCSDVEARGYDVVSSGFLEAEKMAKKLFSK